MESSESQKAIDCVVPLIGHSGKGKTIGAEIKSMDSRGWGRSKGHEGSSWDDLDVGVFIHLKSWNSTKRIYFSLWKLQLNKTCFIKKFF